MLCIILTPKYIAKVVLTLGHRRTRVYVAECGPQFGHWRRASYVLFCLSYSRMEKIKKVQYNLFEFGPNWAYTLLCPRAITTIISI